MARAAVLGATGHIGAHITRALLAGGHAVRAVYRRDRYLHVLDQLSVDRVQADVDDAAALRRAIGGCDWVFHAAGYYPPPGTRRATALDVAIRSTRRIADTLHAARIGRVVFTSSASTTACVHGRLATDADPEPWPADRRKSLYGTVKTAMEHEMRRAAAEGLPVVIVNPSICLGEYDAHAFSGRAVLAFARGRLPFYVPAMMSFIYTGDVGVGHVRAAERGRIGERYLFSSRNMPVRDFAGLVARTAGVRPPRIRVPHAAAYLAALASEAVARLQGREPLLARDELASARRRQGLDAGRAVRELGLPQTPIEEAVARALDWFKRNRYI